LDDFTKKICEEFGMKLKRYRTGAKVTQLEIAKTCELSSAQFISNIERGICWPPMNILAKMSRSYSIPKEELLEIFFEARLKIWKREMESVKPNKTS
jgi:transcriptional regulator with XRE-family HTH domain